MSAHTFCNGFFAQLFKLTAYLPLSLSRSLTIYLPHSLPVAVCLQIFNFFGTVFCFNYFVRHKATATGKWQGSMWHVATTSAASLKACNKLRKIKKKTNSRKQTANTFPFFVLSFGIFMSQVRTPHSNPRL